MPKATLTFTLPEEREEYDLALNGSRAQTTIDDIDNYLRGKIKYGNLTEEQEAIYEEIRNKLHELKSYNS